MGTIVKKDDGNKAARDFIHLWQSRDTNPETIQRLDDILSTTPLSSWAIHGHLDQAGFRMLLSADEWKRLSWVFGPEAIREFLGKSLREICIHLGFRERWIDAKIKVGVQFMLTIFPSESVEVRQAMWDGVEYLLGLQYPKVWDKINAHLPQIRSMTIEQIYNVVGYDMESVNLAGRYDHQTGKLHDDWYISLQRLIKREGTLMEVRQFLYYEIGIRRLYTGLGYTLNDDGERGSNEYLARYMKLKEIKALASVNIVPVDGSELGKDGDM